MKLGVEFAGLWFFLVPASASTSVPSKDTVFGHRMYLALAVVITVAVWGAHALLDRLEPIGEAGAERERALDLDPSHG